VEVELEAAVTERLGLDVPSRAVGLVPACRIAEGNEEPIALREGDEADTLAADVEAHRARAGKVVGRSVAHLDLFDRAATFRIDRDREAETLVQREVPQALEVRALIHRERRVVRMPEVMVFLFPKIFDVHRTSLRVS